MIGALSDGDVEALRADTEKLLADTGFRLLHGPTREKARRAGARVDGETVRLPPALQRELLTRAPASYEVTGLDGTRTRLGEGGRAALAIVTDPWILDYGTRARRRPRLEDLRRHTIVGQGLPFVRAFSRMDHPVEDVEGSDSSLRALEVHLLHHAKHNFVLPADLESLRLWLRIAEVLARGRSLDGSGLLTVGVPVISPLTVSPVNGALLETACAHGFPVIPTVCPMAGSTAPYSRAGTLLLGNAENVLFAALVQILRPGNPVLYAFGPSVTDLRTGHDLYYTLDKALWKAAAVRLARSYGLPCGAECGGTMGFRYDPQAGAEGFLFMLAAWSSGADLLAGIGSCGNAVGMSAEHMLIQSAWLDAARHLGDGMRLDAAHRAADALARVGPGGNFLADQSTVEFLHEGEFFEHDLWDRSGGPEDGKAMLERAHEKAESMVAAFRTPVPEDVREDLERLFRRESKGSGGD